MDIYNKTNHDSLLKKILYRKDGSIISSRIRSINNRYPNVKQYIQSRYSDSTSSEETLNRILYGIEVRPVCKVCGGKVAFVKKHFREYCCTKCMVKGTQEKRKKTLLKKYGSTCTFTAPTIKEKAKQTLLNKYGVDNSMKCNEIANKVIETKIERYGCVKSKEEIEKTKQTIKEKYGVDNPFLLKNGYEKSHSKIGINKCRETKRKHHTFNTSKPEECLYNILKLHYGKNDVLRQYKSDEYPWCCDFYIKSISLYIELQGYWTHNTHPYDCDSADDNKQVNEWKIRNTPLYKNAVKVWTITDPQKRNTAKNNKLNYIEIFTSKIDDSIINELEKYNGGYLIIS